MRIRMMSSVESSKRVAYQGEPASFSEQAAKRMLGDFSAVLCRTFDDLFRAAADCYVVPIENSLAGSIHRNYDLLLSSGLTIRAETSLRIVHNLIGTGSLDEIRRVYSHPVALAQCERYLVAHPHFEPVEVHDTAGAVRMIVERGHREEAAIASAEAAALYGGTILAREIEDDPQNFTRFLLLAREPMALSGVKWKTSLVFRLPNVPGSLHQALGTFAKAKIDLAKIESRPVQGRPWEYSFYADVIGAESEPAVARALDELRAMAEMLRILGSYPEITEESASRS
jgi:prephenate dehydratase